MSVQPTPPLPTLGVREHPLLSDLTTLRRPTPHSSRAPRQDQAIPRPEELMTTTPIPRMQCCPVRRPQATRRSPTTRPPFLSTWTKGRTPTALATLFEVLEDPVHRKVNTSSIAGAKAKGIAPLSKMRFELVPGEVHFGTLREGCTYAFSVNLKNCGIDTCRYKVKRPPPATGLQVVYTPGPVSAGMKAVLELQLYAIAVGVTGDSGQGSIGHHVEFITEMEQLYLPVTANILTAHEYDERCRIQGMPRVSAGVRLISARPPFREGIIRPRKTQQPGTTLETNSQLVQ